MQSIITCKYQTKRVKHEHDQLINLPISITDIISVEKKLKWFIKFKIRDAEPVIWCFMNDTSARDSEYERILQMIKEIQN